jgi:TRAP-type C4-dicarboxylate transport system permease small subunit
MHIDPRLATVLAVILIVVGAVIVITSGESVAVRFLTAIVTLDIAIRLYSHASAHDHTH